MIHLLKDTNDQKCFSFQENLVSLMKLICFIMIINLSSVKFNSCLIQLYTSHAHWFYEFSMYGEGD